jgi:cephalosporin hydroxylase
VITIDEARGSVTVEHEGETDTYGLDTPEGFKAVSDAWLRAGWGVKHVYTFTWLGRPIIQLPEDMFRIQELIWEVKPDVIVETGVAHGGSLVFYASLCHALGHGRVIGVDVVTRPHNRRAIEEHPLSGLITLVEGDSVAEATVERVRAECGDAASVFVVLDSRHTREHVRAELEAYTPLVSVGSYVVAMDGGIMGLVAGGPRTSADWATNNPSTAAAEFVANHPDFDLVQPTFAFNESTLSSGVSYSDGGFIRRRR